MNNKRLFILISLLIAIIIAGVSCKAKPTEVNDFTFTVDDSDLPDNNPTDPDPVEPTPDSTYPNSPEGFDGGTYYEVYVPFAGVGNVVTVSHQDKDTLMQLWKDQIDAKGKGDNVDFFLKNGYNPWVEANFKKDNDYYYFDKDFNIYHKKYPNVLLKKLVGGVITFYNHNDMWTVGKGTRTVGGLYQTVLTDLSKVGNDLGIKFFMSGRKSGELEVMVLNVEVTQQNYTQFAMDIAYYNGSDIQHNRLRNKISEWYALHRVPSDVLKILYQKPIRDVIREGDGFRGYTFYFIPAQKEINRISTITTSSKVNLKDSRYNWTKNYKIDKVF